jgi:hypothetical protein
MARHISVDALEWHLHHDQIGHALLPPEAAAKMIGVTTKWLAAAREGRKEIEGPPFVKLGHGRTSPVRYPYDELLAWVRALKRMTSTTRNFSSLSSFEDFRKSGKPSARWLFAVNKNDGTTTDIFAAIREGLLDSKDYSYRWIRFTDYTAGRFFPVRVVLDAETRKRLREVGEGDISAGLATLLNIRQ